MNKTAEPCDSKFRILFKNFVHRRSIGSGVLILICLVNIQYSGKGSNSSREQVVNPVSLLWMILLIRSRFRL